MALFHRKNHSVYIGTSMVDFNRIRDCLEAERIPYRYNTKNHQSQFLFPGPGTVRGRMGSAGISPDVSYEYEVFVYPEDSEKVSYLIRELNKGGRG